MRTLLAIATTFLFVVPVRLSAHCDGLDGPVVQSARKALETGNVNLVLPWIQKQDEPEIRQAFARTLKVRGLNADTRELADRYFFETLVRVHRAGEGAPSTGLKPAGRDLGPVIPAADQAIESGSAAALAKLLAHGIEAGVAERFEQVRRAKDFPAGDVEAGRRYVKAYVEFLHYVEQAGKVASAAPGHPDHQDHQEP